MTILSKMIYKLKAISIKLLTAFFVVVVVVRLKKEINPEIHMQSQGILNNQNNLEKVEKLKTFYYLNVKVPAKL